jgi:penicillin-binding protein 1A
VNAQGSAPPDPAWTPPRGWVERTARLALVLIPVLALLGILGARLLVTSDLFTHKVALALAGEVANRTQSSVQIGAVRFGWDLSPCLEDLEIYRSDGAMRARVVVKRACVERWGAAIGSGFRATRLRLEQPSIELVGKTSTSARALVEVAPRAGGEGGDAPRARTFRELELVFDDLRLAWDGLPVPARFAEGSFGPIDGQVTVQLRGGRSAAMLTVREPRSGAQIQGRVAPRDGGWDLSASAEGDLVPIFRDVLEAAELDVRRLSTRGRLGAFYETARRTLTVDLDLAQDDIDLASAAVSGQRLSGLTARENLRLTLDLGARTLRTEDAVVELGGVPVLLSLEVEPGVSSPRFAVRVDLRSVPLTRLLRAVPGNEPAMVTRTLSPQVLFALSFSMQGELTDPASWEPRLEHAIQGLDEPGARSGLEGLTAPFEYHPLTPQGRKATALVVGPGTPDWVPIRDIPYVQRRAVIVSEDGSFPFHRGIELTEIREAVKSSVASGKKARGGSTLTQQLVKNLFLTRERTALRKLMELVLTFHLESSLSKDQILELYLNVIEWGPDLYGIGPAARHYFGRPPSALGPLEMAYLATIIPNPVGFHAHRDAGAVPPAHQAKVLGLLERLAGLGQLPPEALEQARANRIVFNRR